MLRARDRASSHDAGSVTLELALVLPSVILILGMVLASGTWLRSQIVATQAAATAARVAITEGVEVAEAKGAHMSGGTVTVAQDQAAGWIEVRVEVGGSGPMPDAVATARVPLQP